MKIHINPFVRRQTQSSPYTHFSGSDSALLERVEKAFDSGHYTTGYRDGVVLVTVPSEGFFTGLVTLREGDVMVGEYRARREGETPRKSVQVDRTACSNAENPDARKQPAVFVQVVLYSHEVLVEDNDHDSDKPWEIISINGYPTNIEAPIDPTTLMHNHFGSDGGTATNMTAREFEAAMRESFAYWKDKALLK